eukprot:11176622-Lingulodinium_polyedra.AAC.1
MVFEERGEEFQREADYPTYVPALKGWSLQHHETQFLSEWFVCRRLDCLWVGLNTLWARNAERHPPLPLDGA